MSSKLIFVLGLFLTQCAQVQSLSFEEKKALVDQKGMVVQTKEEWNDKIATKLVKSKFEKLEKTSISFHAELLDTIVLSYYFESKFLFLFESFNSGDYLKKGHPSPEMAIGEMTELKEYYQDKSNGIGLKRRVEYFEYSNLDSLQQVLLQIPFDTLLLNADDYKKRVSSFKRFKKIKQKI